MNQLPKVSINSCTKIRINGVRIGIYEDKAEVPDILYDDIVIIGKIFKNRFPSNVKEEQE